MLMMLSHVRCTPRFQLPMASFIRFYAAAYIFFERRDCAGDAACRLADIIVPMRAMRSGSGQRRLSPFDISYYARLLRPTKARHVQPTFLLSAADAFAARRNARAPRSPQPPVKTAACWRAVATDMFAVIRWRNRAAEKRRGAQDAENMMRSAECAAVMAQRAYARRVMRAGKSPQSRRAGREPEDAPPSVRRFAPCCSRCAMFSRHRQHQPFRRPIAGAISPSPAI